MKTGLFKNFLRSILLFLFSTGSAISGFSQCSTLIFSDEFSGNSVDLSKWSFDNGDGCPDLCGWGNAEEQWYRSENTEVKDGKLLITTKNESFGSKSFTSSKLITSGKFSSKYGRYEARIKLPSAGGIWPAFWMLPENGNWPFTGEIDIMEAAHKNPEAIGGTVHYSNGGWQYNGKELETGIDLSEGFHTYAVEWEPNEIRWYFDDQQYHTVTPSTTVDPWPFSNGSFYLILNVAVGGTATAYTGNIPPVPADYPTQMEVDYVRVYQGGFTAQLSGDRTVYEGDTKRYAITPIDGASYSWSVPAGALISSGQGTDSVEISWGTEGGQVAVTVNDPTCGSKTYTMEVVVNPPRTLDFILENFEDQRNVSYGQLTSGVLNQSVANPDPAIPNNSGSVGRYQRNGTSQYDALFIQTPDIANALDYVSGKKAIWMELYSDAPVGTELILQLENGSLSTGNYPQGRHSRFSAITTVQNQWETIEFELLDTPDTTVGAMDIDQIVLLIDPNSFTSHTIYFDNMRSMIAPDTVIVEETILANYDGINQISPFFQDGTYSETTANPSREGINISENVGKYTRNAATQYDVISFSTSSIKNSAPFKSGDQIFLLDVYTQVPEGTAITISLENRNTSESGYPSGRNSQYKGTSCVGTAENGEYRYQITNDKENPSLTFIPEIDGVGDAVCILYYESNPAKTFAGYEVEPNVPYQISAAEGEEVFFYYTYSLPSGGEHTTLNDQHGFVVGSCERQILNVSNKTPKNKEITIFPNPFSETIQIKGLQHGDALEIYDLQGNQLLKRVLSQENYQDIVDLKFFANGFYLLRVGKQDQSYSQTFRLIKK